MTGNQRNHTVLSNTNSKAYKFLWPREPKKPASIRRDDKRHSDYKKQNQLIKGPRKASSLSFTLYSKCVQSGANLKRKGYIVKCNEFDAFGLNCELNDHVIMK
jgi:hypothetical protein